MQADPALLLTAKEKHSASPQDSCAKGMPFCCYILWKDTPLRDNNFFCSVPLPKDRSETKILKAQKSDLCPWEGEHRLPLSGLPAS